MCLESCIAELPASCLEFNPGIHNTGKQRAKPNTLARSRAGIAPDFLACGPQQLDEICRKGKNKNGDLYSRIEHPGKPQ
jgi:hypothetical protein